MAATTIKVSSELRDRLNAEARRAGTTAAGVIEALIAERERSERFQAMREAIAATTPENLAEYPEEVAEWQSVVGAGLEQSGHDDRTS